MRPDRPLLRRARGAATLALALAAASGVSGCASLGFGGEDRRAAPPPAHTATHTVRPGDTVFGVAKRYGVSAGAIRDLNQLDSEYRIHVGQRLMLPGGARGGQAAPAGAPVAAAPPSASPTRRVAAVARRASTAQAASFTPSSSLKRPVEGEIIREYGEGSGARRNKGVDLAADPGAPVLAAAAGQVAFVSDGTSPVGSVVLMQHAGGMTTIYGRLQRVAVRVGQQVGAGQPIAEVAHRPEGEPALHFELRRGSDPVNPTPYL